MESIHGTYINNALILGTLKVFHQIGRKSYWSILRRTKELLWVIITTRKPLKIQVRLDLISTRKFQVFLKQNQLLMTNRDYTKANV